MALFSKDKVEKKLGASFPFMERDANGLSLRYDGMRISKEGGTITTTYMQDDIPIYAYTFEVEGDYTVNFNNASGKVRLDII